MRVCHHRLDPSLPPPPFVGTALSSFFRNGLQHDAASASLVFCRRRIPVSPLLPLRSGSYLCRGNQLTGEYAEANQID